MDGPLDSVARPKQGRSEQTLRRILDAAEALIEQHGLAAVSIGDIVRQAQSSVGGFYSRFRDKDELLRALHERFRRELQVRIDELSQPEAWRDASLQQMVRALLEELVSVFRSRQRLMGAFMAQAVRDEEMCRAATRFRSAAMERFAELMLSRREEVGHPHPERGVWLAIEMVFALMNQLVIYGELRTGDVPLSDGELVTELERNFMAYLGR